MQKTNDQSAMQTIDLQATICEDTKAMKAHKSRVMKCSLALSILVTLLASLLVQADESKSEQNARMKEKINLVIQELFWRARAEDYTVFWENEFTYFQEENSLPAYLAQRQFTGPGHALGDSTISTYLDSVTIVADTALAHLMTTVVSSLGDTGQVYTPQTLLYEAGRWKKAMSSTSIENDMYFEKIKAYREAAEDESSGK